MECHKKAIDEANKHFNKIIEEVRPYGEAAVNKN